MSVDSAGPARGGRATGSGPARRWLVVTVACTLLVLPACTSGTEPTPASNPSGAARASADAAASSSPTSPMPIPTGDEPVDLDPADFTPEITNRFWPMDVGDRWVYEEVDDEGEIQTVEVTVGPETHTVAAGIEARVVHDVVTQDGEVVEDTYDWYAQDRDGNIWYLGEDTTEFEDGEPVSTAGSWEAGVDGAQPGVLIPVDPRPGMAYRQEHLAGEAEDRAEVVSLSEEVTIPLGTFTDVLQTRETTPLEPDVEELKHYAPGIGLVLVVQTSGGSSRETLVETSRRPD